MSWLGLRHKGVEVLFPEEWNLVVDGLDILYGYTAQSVKYQDLVKLPSDLKPDQDNKRDLGNPDRAWKEVHAHYGYFSDDCYARGGRVLTEFDPLIVYEFADKAKLLVENIYDKLLDVKGEVRDVEGKVDWLKLYVEDLYERLIDVKGEVERVEEKADWLKLYVQEVYDQTRPPEDLDTFTLTVGTTPIPLSEVERLVKRIHVKLPSWALYLAYLGSRQRQEFILEPGDKEVLEVRDASKVYVRALGEVKIHVMFEL